MITRYSDRLGSAAGLSPALIEAISLILLIPVLTLLGWAISFSSCKRRYGFVGLVALLAAYFLALSFVTTDQRVSATGAALQCYVVTSEGVLWKDIRYQGVDPKTGKACEPAKPYLISTLNRLDTLLRAGKSLNPVEPDGHFFSPIGDPLVWYSASANGEFVFFDAPGFDPATGERLLPISKDIVLKWQQEQTAKIEAAKRQDQEREEKQRVAQQKALEADAARKAEEAWANEQARLAEMKNLVVGRPTTQTEYTYGIAVVGKDSGNSLDKLAASKLPDAISNNAPTSIEIVPRLFAQKFADDGDLSAALRGDLTSLSETNALEVVNHLLLGIIHVECVANTVVSSLRNCTVTLTYQRFVAGPTVVDSGTLSQIGPGSTDEAATNRGVELLVERSKTSLFTNG